MIYQPYQGYKEEDSPITLRFLKIANPHLPNLPADVDTEDERHRPLRAIPDLGGYSTVYVPGASPRLILKSASSAPQIVPVKSIGIRALCGLHTATCEKGLLYITDNVWISSFVREVADLSRRVSSQPHYQWTASSQPVGLQENLLLASKSKHLITTPGQNHMSWGQAGKQAIDYRMKKPGLLKVLRRTHYSTHKVNRINRRHFPTANRPRRC